MVTYPMMKSGDQGTVVVIETAGTRRAAHCIGIPRVCRCLCAGTVVRFSSFYSAAPATRVPIMAEPSGVENQKCLCFYVEGYLQPEWKDRRHPCSGTFPLLL